jgi:uncharacterized low-complexity protein
MNAITPQDELRTEATRRLPSRASGVMFAAKAAAFRLERHLQDFASPVPRLTTGEPGAFPTLLARSITPLWSDPRLSEVRHQRGKVHNLRRAAAALDRLVLPAHAPFSFWQHIGKPTRSRGFAQGRMLQEGCLVTSTGGGLCQLSNALYAVALEVGAEVLERHAHSRVVPGSHAAAGRDATVAWNYVDLRFRAAQDLLLRVTLDAATLRVSLHGRSLQPAASPRAVTPVDAGLPAQRTTAGDCGSCGEIACHRHEGVRAPARAAELGRTAFILDEAWPEFRAYVSERRARQDMLAIPLDGARWTRPRYAWPTTGFEQVATATAVSLRCAASARILRQQSQGRRVAAQLRRDEAVANRLAAALTPDVTDVVVAQSFLPFLWRDGHLGGRRFTVLMTRLPMRVLQHRLDQAAVLHPERATLTDFRAPSALVEAEAAALAAAERVVTPHTAVAALFPLRAELLDWQRPAPACAPAPASGRLIAFPGPSLARKGAHAVRDAALALDLDVAVSPRAAEGAGFWTGVPVRPLSPGKDWLDGVAAVVHPALIEEQPRRLLAALAAGVPVVATTACGLSPRPGLTLIPEDDGAALTRALSQLLQTVTDPGRIPG